MKLTLCFFSACVVLTLVKADTSVASYLDEYPEKLANALKTWYGKFSEATGIQTEFDKDKAVAAIKPMFNKFSEIAKNLEKDGDFKKSFEGFIKQCNETIKGLNTPEIQAKVQKLIESFQTSFKKLFEQGNEIAKSLGIALPPSIQKSFNEIHEQLTKTHHKLQEKPGK